MPDDPSKVFDVSRPEQTRPAATSRPVIVGHKPIVHDPMVAQAASTPEPTDSHETPNDPAEHKFLSDDHQAATPLTPDESRDTALETTHQPQTSVAPLHDMTMTPAHPPNTVISPGPSAAEQGATSDKPDVADSAVDGDSSPATAPLAKAEEQKNAEEHASAIEEAAQKLIDSKEYNVVTGHFHHKGSSRWFVIVMVVVIAAGIAAALFVLK